MANVNAVNANDKQPQLGTRWRLLGNRAIQIGRHVIQIATKGVSNGNVYDEAPESEDLLLEVLQERLRTRRQYTFSLGHADDFLPLSFLETGVKSSQAVCRIARYLSLSEFQELVQSFNDVSDKDKYTAANLVSILGIPEKLALEEIFEVPDAASLNNIPSSDAIARLETAMTDNILTRINPVALGTGFLVGGNHLMTNNHVVATAEEARSCVAQFNYVQDALGGATTVIEYELDPEVLFVTNPALDYTLVQLKAGMTTRPAGFQFGWLQLSGNNASVCPGVTLNTVENQATLLKAIVRSHLKKLPPAIQSVENQAKIRQILERTDQALLKKITAQENDAELTTLTHENNWGLIFERLANASQSSLTQKILAEIFRVRLLEQTPTYIIWQYLKQQILDNTETLNQLINLFHSNWDIPYHRFKILEKVENQQELLQIAEVGDLWTLLETYIFWWHPDDLYRKIFSKGSLELRIQILKRVKQDQLIQALEKAGRRSQLIQILELVNQEDRTQALENAENGEQVSKIFAEVENREHLKQILGENQEYVKQILGTKDLDQFMPLLERANQDQLIQILHGAKRDTQLISRLDETSYVERVQFLKGFAEISSDLLIDTLAKTNHVERVQVLAEIDRESIVQILQQLSSKRPEGTEKEKTKAISNLIADLIDHVNSNAEGQIEAIIQQLLGLSDQSDVTGQSKLPARTVIDEDELGERDRLFIIQHPKGRRKEFDPSGSQILDYHSNGLMRDFIRYSSNADYGSSGSPVFNERWELVALHHAAILKPTDENSIKQAAKKPPIESFQGVRICRIVEDLHKRTGLNPKLRNFLQDFVMTPEQIAYPPISSSLEFNGGRGISLDDPVCFITEDDNNSFRFWSLRGSDLGTISLEQNSVLALSGDSLIALFKQVKRQGADEIIISSFQRRSFENSIVEVITDRNSPADKKLSSDEVFFCCAMSPDNESIAFYTVSETNSEKTYKLRLWPWNALLKEASVPAEEGQRYFDLPASKTPPQFIQFTPNSKSFAVFFQDGQIVFWHVDTIKQSQNSSTVSPTTLGNKAKATDVVRQLSFSADSQLLTIVSDNSKIQIWKSETGTWQTFIKLAESQAQTSPPVDVTFSPNGLMLAYLMDKQGVLLRSPERSWQELSTSTNQIKFSPPEISATKSLKFSPDGKKLALVVIDKYRREELQIWEVLNASNNVQINLIDKWTAQANRINRIYYVPERLYTDLVSSPVYAGDKQRQLTIEIWTNPINGTLISKEHKLWGTTRTGGFSLSIESGSVQAEFSLFHLTQDRTYSWFNVGSSPGALQANQLNHIALTVDTVAQIANLYINGSLVGHRDYSYEDYRLLFDPVTPYLLGNSFNGFVKELRIWDHLRTPEAIRANQYQKLYDRPSGLIGYWHFDEEMQESKKIYNLANPRSSCYSLAQAQKWVRPGLYPDQQFSVGVGFWRQDDALSCTIARPSAASGITVEAWVRHKFGDVGLFHLRQSQDKRAKYVLAWSDDKVRVTLEEKGVRTAIVMAHIAPVDQLWHHIAFSWDKESQEVRLYFDGRPQPVNVLEGRFETLEVDGQLQQIILFPATLSSFPDEVQLGKFTETSGGCKVTMAEVRLWKVARSPSQIKNNLNRRLTHRDRDWSDLVSYWRLNDGDSSRTARNWVETQPPLKPIAPITAATNSNPVPSITSFATPTTRARLFTPPSSPSSVAPFTATPAETVTSTLVFTDIQQHWAESVILDLARRGILKGYPDRTFKPNQPMNRAELATVLVRAFSLHPIHPDPSFTDVPSNQWAQSAIWQAYRTQLLTFPGQAQFEPERVITRIQAVIVLVAALRNNKPLPNANLTLLEMFNDVDRLRPTVKATLAIAVQTGIVKQPKTMSSFYPLQVITRAEVCDRMAQALALYDSQNV